MGWPDLWEDRLRFGFDKFLVSTDPHIGFISMIDRAAEEFTRQGVHRRGIMVSFQRITGFAPNATILSADVMAIVESVLPDTEAESYSGHSARKPGSISQNDRAIIVMAGDLEAAGFPLPIVKGDKIVISMSGDKFSVTKVDSYKRAMAGAIELTATGVA
jgi:hypothetical protein